MTEPQHILITGTTSGIGLGALKAYRAMGWRVTAINRRKVPALEAQFPDVRFHHFDVRDLESVKKYFQDAAEAKQLPTVYLLSAGINKVDNYGVFSLDVFREVVDTNMMGVLNFVSVAIPYLANSNGVFVVAASTSNIFPNPNCMGYFISKLAVTEIFKRMDRLYRGQGLRFKTLILGPIATNIFVGGQMASKLQMAVRNLITVSVDDTMQPIMRFIQSDRQSLCYPKRSYALFVALSVLTKVYPGFYKGSAPASSAK